MIKVKLESDNDHITDDISNPLGTSCEQEVTNSIQMNIKQENELIIEPELIWMPTKLEDEQQEYYEQQNEDIKEEEVEGLYILPTTAAQEHEEFSIEYIDEEEEEYGDDDYEDDNEDLNDNDDMENDDYMNITHDEINDDIASGSKGNKKTFCKRTFSKWLCGEYIKRQCVICEEKFENHELWCQHIEQQHQDDIQNIKSNYHFIENCHGICKQCNKLIKQDYFMLLHALRHATQVAPNPVICNLCSFKSTKATYIQLHIMEQHPNVVELFKTLDIPTITKTYECPLCKAIFKRYIQIQCHFRDNHPEENSAKYHYECHLCPFTVDNYDKVKEFYQHLLEEHNLNDWNLLNFRQIELDLEHTQYACTKCFKIFTELDIIKFLQHHLEHDNRYWSCSSCSKKISFRLHTCYHMCNKLFRRLRKTAEKSNKTQLSVSGTSQDKRELSSWQEFEDYVQHICPFCNKEFNHLQKWQMHLRKIHLIDTLKGLEMKPLADESNKLQCNICNTLIMNSSVPLHTHRFQHLPYKPYKCRHCLKSLANYKTALSHVLNKCQLDNDNKFKGFLLHNQKDKPINITEYYKVICPLCKEDCQTFADDELLWLHYEVQHNNFLQYFSQQLDNSMLCKICEQSFAIFDKNLCVRHMLKHFIQKPYNCLKCEVTFLSRKGIKRHVPLHFAIPINLNNSHTEPVSTLNLEMNKARVGRSTDKTLILNEFIDYITYACPECNVCLDSQQMWHDHINTKHTFFNVQHLSIKDPVDGSHKCKHCNLKTSSSLVQRQKHKLTHMPHKAFICSLCYHRCNSLGVLYGHLRRLHFAKGSYKCPLCSVVSTTPYASSEHLKNTHPRSEWPSSTCLVCYKTMSSNSSLKNHMLIHDINRPKFECEYCGAKIICGKDYNSHVARHLKAMSANTETNTEKESTTSLKSPCKEEEGEEEKDLLEISKIKRPKIEDASKN